MTSKQYKRALGVFSNHQDTELALRKLRKSHFPMHNVSVIAQNKDASDLDTVKRERVGNHATEGVEIGVMTGGALGGIAGLLVGLGTLAIPGIGPIMLAGAAATTIATTIASSSIGAVAGSLVGGLIGLGIPEEKARFYKQRIKQGDYLIIIEDTFYSIRFAEAILKDCGIKKWEIYDTDAPEPVAQKEDNSYMRGIGAFTSRDRAQVAIGELIDAGFPLNQVTLITSNETEDNWFPSLIISSYLDDTPLQFPEERRQFFQTRFDRGEYLLMIDGTEDEFHRAEKILDYCGVQGFYIYDPSLSDAVPVINDQPKLTNAVPKFTESQSHVSTNPINSKEKVIADKIYATVDNNSRVVIIDNRV